MTKIEIKPRDLARHELIGLKCKVVEAPDPSMVDFEGEVVDETRNMLILRSPDKERKIQKKYATFIFDLQGLKVRVLGSGLIGRPEDRSKKHHARSQRKIKER